MKTKTLKGFYETALGYLEKFSASKVSVTVGYGFYGASYQVYFYSEENETIKLSGYGDSVRACLKDAEKKFEEKVRAGEIKLIKKQEDIKL